MFRYLILFLILPFFLCAQLDKLEINRSQFTSSTGVWSRDTSLFVNVSKNQLFNTLATEQWIFRLNDALHLSDSINLSAYINPLGLTNQNPRVHQVCFNDSALFCLVELQDYNLDSLGCYQGRSIILELDYDLEFKARYSVQLDSGEVLLYGMDLKNDTLIATGMYRNCQPNYRKPFVYRLSLITGSSDYLQIENLPSSVSYFNNPKIVEAGYLTSSMRWTNRALLLNRNLEVEAFGKAFWQNQSEGLLRNIRTDIDFIPVNRDSVIVFGTAHVLDDSIPLGLDEYHALGISLLDSSLNVGRIDTFPLAGFDGTTSFNLYSRPWPGFKPYDYRNLDSVLITISQHLINYDNFQSQDSNTIYLYNYNARRMEMNWIKTIKTNYTSSDHSLAALPGNRWVLSFNEYNWDRYQGPNLSVHLWLLDQNGSILNQEKFTTAAKGLELYPNPTKSKICLDPNPMTDQHYFILNQQGQKVKAGLLREGEKCLAVSDLGPGLYWLWLENGRRKRFLIKA